MDLEMLYNKLRRHWYDRKNIRGCDAVARIFLWRTEAKVREKGYTASDYAKWFMKYRVKRGAKFPKPEEFASYENLREFLKYKRYIERKLHADRRVRQE